MPITKNNISYFQAGYKSCLAVNRLVSPEEIEKLDYTDINFSNKMLSILRAYNRAEFDEEGLKEMYKFIKEYTSLEDGFALKGEMLSGLPELPTKKELNVQEDQLKDVTKQIEMELMEDILKDSGIEDDGDLDIRTMKDLIVNLIKDNKYIR
jgi:hypothetical protein